MNVNELQWNQLNNIDIIDIEISITVIMTILQYSNDQCHIFAHNIILILSTHAFSYNIYNLQDPHVKITFRIHGKKDRFLGETNQILFCI